MFTVVADTIFNGDTVLNTANTSMGKATRLFGKLGLHGKLLLRDRVLEILIFWVMLELQKLRPQT